MSQKLARIIDALTQTDRDHDTPLGQIAQRANAIINRAAIVNRHNRRPPLYAESTIGIFVELGLRSPRALPAYPRRRVRRPPSDFPAQK